MALPARPWYLRCPFEGVRADATRATAGRPGAAGRGEGHAVLPARGPAGGAPPVHGRPVPGRGGGGHGARPAGGRLPRGRARWCPTTSCSTWSPAALAAPGATCSTASPGTWPRPRPSSRPPATTPLDVAIELMRPDRRRCSPAWPPGGCAAPAATSPWRPRAAARDHDLPGVRRAGGPAGGRHQERHPPPPGRLRRADPAPAALAGHSRGLLVSVDGVADAEVVHERVMAALRSRLPAVGLLDPAI